MKINAVIPHHEAVEMLVGVVAQQAQMVRGKVHVEILLPNQVPGMHPWDALHSVVAELKQRFPNYRHAQKIEAIKWLREKSDTHGIRMGLGSAKYLVEIL